MKIESQLYSLSEIVQQSPAWNFNIPIYQRLYVWGEDQVRTLVHDLINAYERDEALFFLGGTLLVEQESDTGRHFDLIDGQQRFTTLWMLCHAWREVLEPFLAVSAGKSTVPRLRFAIRPEVNLFLESLTFHDRESAMPDAEATRSMRVALALIKSEIYQRPLPGGVTDQAAHLSGLAAYVFDKVKFVITTVPKATDLNKLFEVINNRGVQLQHHEILKARMLDALTEMERGPYAVLWDACANMEGFVERNLGGTFKGFASEVADCYERGLLGNANDVLSALEKRTLGQSEAGALSLTDILNSDGEAGAPDTGDGIDEADPTWVRSIFGFPLFLQHTLRIWLHKNNHDDLPRLLDRELLELFDKHFFSRLEKHSEGVKSFIDLLWQLRVTFDEHFIKWVDQGEEEVHLISSISVSTSSGKRYMSRSRDSDVHRGFSMLQSMLYHSQEITTQYWVTPLLLFMHENAGCTGNGREAKVNRYFEYLRHLDNHLLGSDAGDALVVRTCSFMVDPWQRHELVHGSELIKPAGVKFAHYWFYKLEFVLWFQNRISGDGAAKFRLTAKSSVEHISPQTPTDRQHDSITGALDNFGNLALVSRGLNSEYGNLPYNEKRQKFLNKNKNRIDSLKMALIYELEHWDTDTALAHQKLMIDYMNSYCESTPQAQSND